MANGSSKRAGRRNENIYDDDNNNDNRDKNHKLKHPSSNVKDQNWN